MKRVLLIEDDKRIIAFVKRGLEAEGYGVDVVSDGEEGIQAGSDDGYGVILLDLMLPTTDGREVCRRLRGRGIDTPILMLTARDAVEDRVEGLRLGADDYLTKPFAFEELLARIEALMRRSPHYRPTLTRFEIGPLTLDREIRQVTCDGEVIKLTPREFALLEFLMSSSGRVVSRTRILEAVWGYQTDPLTNVVEVYIRQLRKKIDQGRETRLIHTVRGFGYKIEVAGS
ncbi:MAG: response regulator transcription factor [Proteobacteria bacterium]|nr:response regulator transcription factor [Pseudomonadota bacterium]